MVTALEALEAAAVISPQAWLRRYTPAAVPSRFAPYHQHLTHIPEPGEAQARVLFRGSAKSTLSRATVLHAAIHQKVRGVLLIRATYADAKGDRESIARMANLAGVESAVDGDTKMVLVGEVPIWTRTPGSAVRGIHWVNPQTGEVVRPDLIVVDDLETRASARSAEQTRKLEEWLTSDAFQVAAQSYPARIIMLGTPITPTCLVARAMRQEPPFDTWQEPLVVPLITDGQPAWPDTYDPHLRDRTPAITMATEYDLEPLPPGTLLFPPRLTHWEAIDGSAGHRLIISVDPAGDGEDATAAVAVAMMPRGLYVVDCLHYTGPSQGAPEAIARFAARIQQNGWLVEGITVEGVGGWAFMRREIAKACAPLRVTGEKPTLGKVDRALPLTVWHQAGAVAAHPRLKGSPWDVELHSFQQDGQTLTGHDDCLDATAWACSPLTRGWKADPPQLSWLHREEAA